MTNVDFGLDDRLLSSRDVQDVAGLTPRQQNDWDGRGALPHDRNVEEGWRRYTPRDVFVLSVCAEIRRQYGTPVERLKYVQDFMLREDANHFQAAARLMGVLGVGVWILTDLEDTFIMDSELEFIDRWHRGFFGAHQAKAFVFLNVNALVNRLLSQLGQVELEAHGLGYDILRDMRARREVRTPEEALVLEKIRAGEFARVEVESPDGQIQTIRTTSRPDPATKLEDLLNQPYQRLEVVAKNGNVVSIRQEVTTKPRKKGTQ